MIRYSSHCSHRSKQMPRGSLAEFLHMDERRVAVKLSCLACKMARFHCASKQESMLASTARTLSELNGRRKTELQTGNDSCDEALVSSALFTSVRHRSLVTCFSSYLRSIQREPTFHSAVRKLYCYRTLVVCSPRFAPTSISLYMLYLYIM